MPTSKAICVAAFTLAVGVSAAARADSTCAQDPELRTFLGAHTLDVLWEAERAEIVRVDAERIEPGKDTPRPAADARPSLGGYPQVGAWGPLDGEIFVALQKALLDRQTYGASGTIKLCGGFHPGVAVRFWTKATKKKPSRSADVLLCFRCSEIASAPESPSTPVRTLDIEPGRLRLLELVAAALPDFEGLARTLAAERGEKARELLFESMFSPDVLLTFRREWLMTDQGKKEAVAALERHASGKALFVLASRALGAKANDLDGTDGPTAVLYAAVRQLSASDMLAGIEAIRGDQVALAGATELLVNAGGGKVLPAQTRAAWGPALLEAFLARNAHDHCAITRLVARRTGRPVVPLLVRVLRGQMPVATWPQRRPPAAQPSDAGCALMALAEVDEDAARVGFATWKPSTPEDALALRAAKVRLGDDDALDASLFSAYSPTVAVVALDGIRAHPDRRGLDVLAASGLGFDSGTGMEGERTFTALTGATTSAAAEHDYERRYAELRAWWSAHRDAWRPRAAVAAPDGAAP